MSRSLLRDAIWTVVVANGINAMSRVEKYKVGEFIPCDTEHEFECVLPSAWCSGCHFENEISCKGHDGSCGNVILIKKKARWVEMDKKKVQELWNMATDAVVDTFNGVIDNTEFLKRVEMFEDEIKQSEIKFEKKIESLKEQLAEQIQYSAKLENALKFGGVEWT